MTNKKITYFLTALMLLCLGSGCKKLIEVDPPNDWVEAGTVFSTDAQATAAIMGLYSTIMEQTKYFLNGGMSLYLGLSADELNRTVSANMEDQFTTNSLSATNALIHNNIWKPAYVYLYQCNAIIKGLKESKSVSNTVKDRLIGEAKFIRALCYFYLTNLFNRVPLALSPNAVENADKPQSSVEAVYFQIIDDLQDASNKLPDTPENTRPNKMACEALLARVFLYKEEWVQAEQAASTIINSGKYQLVTNLNQVFVSDSRETVFQLAPVVKPFNTAEGYIFIPASQTSRPNYMVTNQLLAAFEVGDNRASCWLDTAQRGSYIFPFKYQIYFSETVSEYNIVLRLAEQYLIRAEARLHQENIAGAVEDLNLIRSRARLSGLLPTINQNECLAALIQERRIELFAEWGHRWIDLKRWGKADSILSIIKASNWQITDQLYPIPASEIEKNPILEQNDGY